MATNVSSDSVTTPGTGAVDAKDAAPPARGTAALLAFVFAATWSSSTAMAAHFPAMMQRGVSSLAVAVAAGALIGPTQVAARLLEFGCLRSVHPLLSARPAALALRSAHRCCG